jgi:hypothetical protein
MKRIMFVCAVSAACAFVMAQEPPASVPPQEPAVTEQPAVTQAPQKLEVKESAVCTAVQDRQPVGTGTSFPVSVGKVYFWTQIAGAEQPTDIKHVWYLKGVQIAEVPLKINFPLHRTWSAKTILPDMAGEWSVEAIDVSGNVLKKETFTITEEAAQKQESVAPAPPEKAPEQPPMQGGEQPKSEKAIGEQ